MSRTMRQASADAGGGWAAPLALIHTNNSPKPVFMRLPEGFALVFGVGNHPTHAAVLSGPIGQLLTRRRADAK